MTDWQGVLDRHEFKAEVVAQQDRVADAARDGRWDRVLELLDDPWSLGPNACRVGGASWFAPLHQAAWHGAPVGVVDELVRRGAWRTLRAADGRRAVDIARQRSHDHLLGALTPRLRVPDDPDLFAALDAHLERVVEGRIRPQLTVRLRHVSCEILADDVLTEPLWFAIPGMYGGFSLTLDGATVVAESWSRVVGGSGQRHEITRDDATLVEEGFV